MPVKVRAITVRVAPVAALRQEVGLVVHRLIRYFSPSFRLAGERVEQRSAFGVSQLYVWKACV